MGDPDDLGIVATQRPAPEPLDLVQALVNTRNLETGVDLLADEHGLERWLRGRGLLGPGARVTRADARRATELREAIRDLLLAHVGIDVEPGANEAFARIAAGAPVVVSVDPRGSPELVPQRSGVRGAFGRLCAVVFAATLDGTWRRLKACRSPTCHAAFYDRSRNNSSHWCSLDECGVPARMREYRSRRNGAQR